jgi:hypothetical protein
MIRMLLYFNLLIGVSAGPAWTQNPPVPDIATDRPAITDSSAVVSKGLFQAESGFLETGGWQQRVLDFPETLVRIGAVTGSEFRVTIPDYLETLSPIPRAPSGFGDLSLGIKQRLGTPGGFEIAAVLSLSLPFGASAISSHGYDPSFNLPWSRKVSENWTLAGMLSVYAPTINGAHKVYGESTILMDRQLTKAWDAFIEYAGDFPESGGPRHLLHFGTAYKVHSHQQIDLHFGVGLSPAAPHHFIGVGYSFCFPLAR